MRKPENEPMRKLVTKMLAAICGERQPQPKRVEARIFPPTETPETHITAAPKRVVRVVFAENEEKHFVEINRGKPIA